MFYSECLTMTISRQIFYSIALHLQPNSMKNLRISAESSYKTYLKVDKKGCVLKYTRDILELWSQRGTNTKVVGFNCCIFGLKMCHLNFRDSFVWKACVGQSRDFFVVVKHDINSYTCLDIYKNRNIDGKKISAPNLDKLLHFISILWSINSIVSNSVTLEFSSFQTSSINYQVQTLRATEDDRKL